MLYYYWVFEKLLLRFVLDWWWFVISMQRL